MKISNKEELLWIDTELYGSYTKAVRLYDEILAIAEKYSSAA